MFPIVQSSETTKNVVAMLYYDMFSFFLIVREYNFTHWSNHEHSESRV